jgi:hypothetical protein
MVRPAWIALELGSATGFPKKKIIPQKPQPDVDPELAARCVLCPATLHAVTPAHALLLTGPASFRGINSLQITRVVKSERIPIDLVRQRYD